VEFEVEAKEATGEDAKGSGEGGKIFVQEPVPRDYYLTKEDVQEHGPTKGCAGYRYFRSGIKQNHTENCRERFRELLKDKARVRLAKEKMEEWNRRKEE
jgi:hypothetical protein